MGTIRKNICDEALPRHEMSARVIGAARTSAENDVRSIEVEEPSKVRPRQFWFFQSIDVVDEPSKGRPRQFLLSQWLIAAVALLFLVALLFIGPSRLAGASRVFLGQTYDLDYVVPNDLWAIHDML